MVATWVLSFRISSKSLESPLSLPPPERQNSLSEDLASSATATGSTTAHGVGHLISEMPGVWPRGLQPEEQHEFFSTIYLTAPTLFMFKAELSHRCGSPTLPSRAAGPLTPLSPDSSSVKCSPKTTVRSPTKAPILILSNFTIRGGALSICPE